MLDFAGILSTQIRRLSALAKMRTFIFHFSVTIDLLFLYDVCSLAVDNKRECGVVLVSPCNQVITYRVYLPLMKFAERKGLETCDLFNRLPDLQQTKIQEMAFLEELLLYCV